MAPAKLCFAGSQNPHSEFKSRPRKFIIYVFPINDLPDPEIKTLGQ
jgi:hypothetical protein